MSAATLTQQTFLPDGDDQLARVHDFMSTHDQAGAGRYLLAGPGAHEQIELPPEIYRALRHVVDALRQGLAVTVAPVTQTLTTQQAADLLGTSRPTVVKLLDDGRIPFERTGTHRRVLLRDLLAFRSQRRAEQYAALEATSVAFEDEADIDDTLQQLKQARQAVARERRARPAG